MKVCYFQEQQILYAYISICLGINLSLGVDTVLDPKPRTEVIPGLITCKHPRYMALRLSMPPLGLRSAGQLPMLRVPKLQPRIGQTKVRH